MLKAASLRGSEAQQGVGGGAGRGVSCCDTEWRQADASSGAISATLLRIFLIHPLFPPSSPSLSSLLPHLTFDAVRVACCALKHAPWPRNKAKGKFMRGQVKRYFGRAHQVAQQQQQQQHKPFIWSAARRDAYIENERECAKKERLMDEGERKGRSNSREREWGVRKGSEESGLRSS